MVAPNVVLARMGLGFRVSSNVNPRPDRPTANAAPPPILLSGNDLQTEKNREIQDTTTRKQ